MGDLTLPLIAATATLIAASIAATVALYVKKLDRRNAAEQRHSDARKEAYEKFLAACDRAWHYRLKICLERYDHDIEPNLEDQQKLLDTIDHQCMDAMQSLRLHSQDMEKAMPVLAHLYMEAFERQSPSPNDYEVARHRLEELVRFEIGLRERLSKLSRATAKMHKRAAEEAMSAINSGSPYFPTFPGVVIKSYKDGAQMMRDLHAIMHEWELLRASLKLQETRAQFWRSKSLWPEIEASGGGTPAPG
ncbi:hypothetical protein [Nonomuraea sp. NEAU-A123]|uniref:hypothetical protein n=1 Tax=Nonomuraea sp. NEAU-A123 TaxID=2839649 RepID=UPI001BE488BC|nr:hypothetical protein [Nonomuraea sp. NEAU-A123]MBT2234679.1 hypothetical protein [Nonomuraea sp. NEAU-A123]